MNKVGIISHEENPVNLLHLLHELDVENPIVHLNEPKLENHFIITVCRLIIIDDCHISFPFLKLAIKNGCNLLFMYFPEWAECKVDELIKLAEEAKVQVYFYDDVICYPDNLKHLTPSKQETLIDCNLQFGKRADLELILFRILLILAMLDNSDLKRIGIINIPPQLTNLRFNLHSGIVLRMLMQTDSAEQTSGFITLYRAHTENFNLTINPLPPIKSVLRTLIQQEELYSGKLPNLNHYRQASKMLLAARKKANYKDFFCR
ncbi:MAG: hypothetical protein ACK5MI_04425 [Mangrovibacterium sp.]